MRTLSKLIALFVLTALPIMGSAQSLSYAKTLIEQERYLEAAKQLRPLADGGNAEAQYLASDLFFKGKGVNKSEVQGIKYATMAANQGYKYAVTSLALHYKDKGDKQGYYNTLKKYLDMYPELQKGTAGILLAFCYFSGEGTEKNPSEGIRIVDRNNILDTDNIYIKFAYWRAKANLAGFSDVRAYNESEYGAGRLQHHAVMARAIYDCFYGHELAKLREAAESGKTWEMAHLSNMLNEPSTRTEARKWAQKAADAGSNYGKGMLQYITSLMQNNSNNNSGSNNTYSSSSSSSVKLGTYKNGKYRTNALDVTLTKVEVTRNYTSITLTYRNKTNMSQRVSINSNTHIVHKGKTYRMISCNVPSSGTYVSKGDTYYITLDFPQIPSDGTDGFDLIENGLWKFYGIKY